MVDSVPGLVKQLCVGNLLQQLPVEDPVEVAHVGQEAVIVGIQARQQRGARRGAQESRVNRMPSAARLSMPGVCTTVFPLKPRASWRC